MAPRILLVDDDPRVCAMVGDLLRLKGYQVETAATGQEGLERLRARPVDVAIVDIMLPDISGLDLLEAIQSSSPDAEVIFISGYVPLSAAREAAHGVAFGYLKKPFELDHLLLTLERALERQRLVRALRESEERHRLITESIDEAVFLLDLENRVVLANGRGEALTGLAADALRGRPLASLLSAEGARAVQEGRSSFEAQVAVEGSRPARVEVRLSPVERGGRPVGRLAVWRDVTEAKRLQQQLIQAEKLATLGEMIAGIAHELNNPLAAMLGQAQLLRMSRPDPATAARVERLIEQAQRATRVVRNFLTFARRRQPERVAVCVNETITKALDLMAYQFRIHSIEAVTALDPDLPPVAADPNQLQQVLLNLFSNAYQAMAGGLEGGTLRVETATDPGRRQVRVRVVDQGPGILPEHLPQIFEPFFTTKPEGEGTGLGLAIARAIVTEHGGTIAAESAPGKGATFTVTLPLTGAPGPAAAATPPRAVPKGLRVLVIDDEPPLRELMEDALTEHENLVVTAGSGRQALDIIARERVDVLVMDLRMPEIAGADLWGRIRERRPELARRTVFCTGDVVREEVRAFLASTGCPSVSKPFDLTHFLDAVARAAAR